MKTAPAIAARLACYLFALLLSLIGLASPGPAEEGVAAVAFQGDVSGRLERILERGELIVGVKNDYPPWGMPGPGGRIDGLEPDLARDLAARLGVEARLVPVSAANRLQRLEQGRIDLVIATMGDTDTRREFADLLQPHYYSSGVRLLAPVNSPFTRWGQLRGREVCLVDGAYFNRDLIERFLLQPVVFKGNREAMLALLDGRCVGWAFDNTVLEQIFAAPSSNSVSMSLLPSEDLQDFRVTLPLILETPWAVAVQSGEGDAPLGRFVSDTIADWHRTRLIVTMQETWQLLPTDFLTRQNATWAETAADGTLLCQRGSGGTYPAACLSNHIAHGGGAAVEVPAWAARAGAMLGMSPELFFDSYSRSKLASGMGITILLSVVSIAGCLAFGLVFGALDGWLRRGAWSIRLLRLPLTGVFAVARMTPPLIQLYLIFFGLSAILANSYAITPGGFLTAAVVFSVYAGAANAVLISDSLARVRAEDPDATVWQLLPVATERVFDGLMASCVNIVKAVGMASTIAVAELISVANTLITDGGDARTLMNLLLVFYFGFVLLVVWLFGVARRRLVSRSARAQP